MGAHREDSGATGIDGNQADNSATDAGAAYVFVRDGIDQWSQQAYVKATNTDPDDWFGLDLALSEDGNMLVVGAYTEQSGAAGINGDQIDESLEDSGAVYVYVRDAMNAWSPRSYVKAPNPGATDRFHVVDLSGDGNTLVVGARFEDSLATGIGGDQTDDSAYETGAAYLY